MIKTIYLANYIERLLNSNTVGLKFSIFADEGDMRKSVLKQGKKNYFVHGLISTSSSTIIPIKNTNFQTISTQLMIIVDTEAKGTQKEGDTNRLQSTELILVKDVLYHVIDTMNGTTSAQTIDGKNYNTTLTFTEPTDGQKMSIGEISNALPLYMNINFVFFENGVSANDCHFYLDGEDLYFTEGTISRNKTADNSAFANENGTKTYVLLGGRSFDLVIPTTDTEVGRSIMHDILGDEINEAHYLKVATPLESRDYIVIYGNDKANMNMGANLGYNVSLAEGKADLLNYNDKWTIETGYFTKDTQVSVTNNQDKEIAVFWGDGTNETITQGLRKEHSYSESKEYTIREFGKAEIIYQASLQSNWRNQLSNLGIDYTAIQDIKFVNKSNLDFMGRTETGIGVYKQENNVEFEYKSIMPQLTKMELGFIKLTCQNLFENCSSLKSISFETMFKQGISSYTQMFANCGNLEEIDLSGFDIAGYSDTQNMFLGCNAIKKIIAPNCEEGVSIALPVVLYADGMSYTSLSSATNGKTLTR